MDYLKKVNSKYDENFMKQFASINGQLILTNYRLLFITNLDSQYATIMRKQPFFVREFFNIPLAYINRVERTVNIYNDNTKTNKYNAYSN